MPAQRAFEVSDEAETQKNVALASVATWADRARSSRQTRAERSAACTSSRLILHAPPLPASSSLSRAGQRGEGPAAGRAGPACRQQRAAS